MTHLSEDLTTLSDKELKTLWMKRKVIKKRGQSPVTVIEQIITIREKVQQIWDQQDKYVDVNTWKDFDFIYTKGTHFHQEDINLIYQDYLETFFSFLDNKPKLTNLSLNEWNNISRMYDRQGFYPIVDRYFREIIFGPTDHPLYLELHSLTNHCNRDDLAKMFSEKLSELFMGLDEYFSEKSDAKEMDLL